MPRPRTPTSILKLRDSFTTHPERLRDRAGEPAPAGNVGRPASWMSAAQRECFEELVARAYVGTLGAGDRFVIELGAVLLEELRRQPGNMSAAKMARLHAVLGSLGLTPADRSKITAARGRGDGASFEF